MLCLRLDVYDADLEEFPIVSCAFYGGSREQCEHWMHTCMHLNRGLADALTKGIYGGNPCVVKKTLTAVQGHLLHKSLGAVED